VYRPFNKKILYKDSPLRVQTEAIFAKETRQVKPWTPY